MKASLALLAAASLMLQACASAPAMPAPATLPMPAMPAAAASEGSIYAAGGMALFEDQKARRVGDTLTIVLVESTTAQKKASTSTAKDSNASIDGPKLFGRPVTVNGVPVLEAELGSSKTFKGNGDSSQSNQLQGSVGAVVMQVLPNGNLVVSGRKQVQINQGSETVSIEGIVRPVDIRPDNSITSDRVANAAISYSGQGAVADSNVMGWASRFFNSGWFPF
ncbi:flagellar basal body L-ring protein FlgH [Solimonas fluminis]|uniref:Flagellar L-ring protein n=1 Tax=Solimonas fluminis TaxID=2086571 RepID=A0A2S5THT5_9GAMM|nr:flagellar basal body L-ring protein FlgH [Solimonas fluminis]PPE74539.1 flagellar basal body L-ring protein FlgH [Solimonas fluminis]